MPLEHAFNDWECKYCGKHYKLQPMALGCEKSHDIVYVPLTTTQIKRLLQFIYIKDDSLLDDDLMKILRKYSHNMSGDQA